jgi:hypothetical protein
MGAPRRSHSLAGALLHQSAAFLCGSHNPAAGNSARLHKVIFTAATIAGEALHWRRPTFSIQD